MTPEHDPSSIVKTRDFVHFLAVFVGYSPRFSGSGRSSMPCEPRYMTLAASSKNVISVIFGHFRGL